MGHSDTPWHTMTKSTGKERLHLQQDRGLKVSHRVYKLSVVFLKHTGVAEQCEEKGSSKKRRVKGTFLKVVGCETIFSKI